MGLIVLSLAISPATVRPGSANPSLVTIATGLNAPYGIAVDSHGNILFTEDMGSVKEILAGTTKVVTIVPHTEPNIEGAAVDPQDNFWYAAYYSGNISDIPAGTNTPTFFTQIGAEGPEALSTDNSGNLYVATFRQNEILRISRDKTVNVLQQVEASCILESVAAEPKGNIYFVCSGGIYTIPAGTNNTYQYYNDRMTTTLYLDENSTLYAARREFTGASVIRFSSGANNPENILQLPDRPGSIAVRGGVMYITFPASNSIGKIILPPIKSVAPMINPVLLAVDAAAVIALVLYILVRRRKRTMPPVSEPPEPLGSKLAESIQRPTRIHLYCSTRQFL